MKYRMYGIIWIYFGQIYRFKKLIRLKFIYLNYKNLLTLRFLLERWIVEKIPGSIYSFTKHPDRRRDKKVGRVNKNDPEMATLFK